MAKKIISFGTRLRKNGYNFTCRELISISPRTILESMEFDNRFVLDDDVKECLTSQKNNKDIFEKIIKINEKRIKHYQELGDSEQMGNSDDLSMGNECMYYIYSFSGIRTGI